MQDKVYIVGRGLPTDPVQGGTAVTDPSLDGWEYSVTKRGVGPLLKDLEWQDDVAGGGWQLLSGFTFQDGEIFTVSLVPKTSNFVSGIQLLTASAVISADMYGKLIVLNSATTVMTVTLPPVQDYPVNVLLPIASALGGQKQSTVLPQAGQNIFYNGAALNALYMGQQESLYLLGSYGVAGIADGWYVSHFDTDRHRMGQLTGGVLPGVNQIPGIGQIILRTEYPAVLDFINRLNTAYPGAVVTAAQWVNDRTKWGFGNGATTIQVPDYRGYFPRYLDLGANVDKDRFAAGTGNTPGSAQAAATKRHSHFTIRNEALTSISLPGDIGRGVSTVKAMIDSYNRILGIGKESYVAAGTAGNFPAVQPDIGPSSIAGESDNETRGLNTGLLPIIWI